MLLGKIQTASVAAARSSAVARSVAAATMMIRSRGMSSVHWEGVNINNCNDAITAAAAAKQISKESASASATTTITNASSESTKLPRIAVAIPDSIQLVHATATAESSETSFLYGTKNHEQHQRQHDPTQSQQQQQQQQQLPHRPFSNTKETTTDSLNTTAGLYQDSVTAEIILAQRWTRDLTGAIETFEAILEKHAEDDLHRWRKTISAGLLAMVASGRGNDAVRVFEILDGDAKSTDCYTTIGRHMSKVQDWKELIDLYRDATAEGYSSEELSMLAMLAVTSTKVDNRLRILRAIVDECATNVGLDPKRWTMTKYWSLKRSLGFYHARLLMWWNDEQRAPLDEANLAIKEFYQEKANGMRPKNDVVRAIVSCASRHDSLGLGHTGGYEKVPRSEDDWTALLQEVLRSTGDSPIRYDPTFIDAVVQAYKSLGKSRECVEYISRVVNVDETRLRQSTLVDALEAAQIEHAEGLYSDIQMLLSLGTERNELE
eukprot:CAMPEP_0168244282 /NCGR_PEP_ID=MMETSP0140_2-20121125/24533_1 /TAXON_ID=44445 /ORGANISM="Pseudo-nitzschia australis, Strain 10249 10 AB" /LENGTH=490 /DNA_ID=CAMNT_0008179765 /DNA_START=314 /DNA_END=1785 /DNA_ORIENTATION=-